MRALIFFRVSRKRRVILFVLFLLLACSIIHLLLGAKLYSGIFLLGRQGNTISFFASSHSRCLHTGSSVDTTFIAGARTKIVLVLTSRAQRTSLQRTIFDELESADFGYVFTLSGSDRMVQVLRELNDSIASIVLESYADYYSLDTSVRRTLDHFCKTHAVGIVSFVDAGSASDGRQVNLSGNQSAWSWSSFAPGICVASVPKLKGVLLNNSSSLLFVTKANGTWRGKLSGSYFSLLTDRCDANTGSISTGERRYSSVLSSLVSSRYVVGGDNNLPVLGDLVLHDNGSSDGVQRVLFGVVGGVNLVWLQRLLLLDALLATSGGRLTFDLHRYMLVDIDDVFMRSRLVNFTVADVQAMMQFQQRMRTLVPGFTLNLGFCGRFYERSTGAERAAFDRLLELAEHFWWFPHTWGHMQPHKMTTTSLVQDMQKNRQFAEQHDIPICHNYSVSPHHSGIYPVDSALFDAWNQVWEIKHTSTEEYPHLKQSKPHRGFIHRNVHVLPRFTCGLFTHTVFLNRYPKGKKVLLNMIEGGSLFSTIVKNPVSVFMTHMPNYAGDRLAARVLWRVVSFLRDWTNVRLQTLPPPTLSTLYFKMFPQHRQPLWTNPCDDPRHLDMWRLASERVVSQSRGLKRRAESFVCSRVPGALVLGPQKTGSTALWRFLRAHPLIGSNVATSTFEETQFFSKNANYYQRGVDWYIGLFTGAANASNNSTPMLWFEKSATYFDSIETPQRAFALLPRVKLVVLLEDPVRRAYSWYQHVRAHALPTAVLHSFHHVVTATQHSAASANLKQVTRLRNRCLVPGQYMPHIERWLRYFPLSQMYFVDAAMLRTHPLKVMPSLMRFLGISGMRFSEVIRFNRKKGFYCVVHQGTGDTQCLGASKGRHYSPMRNDTALFLQRYYAPYNARLLDFLTRNGLSVPEWLLTAIGTSRNSSLLSQSY